MNLLTPEEIAINNLAFDNKLRSVFGSGAGKEILTEFRRRYVESKLMMETDRNTAYCIGQRDLILEIMHTVNNGD